VDLRSNRFALAVLVALHFVLALAYAFQTPYRSPGHYALMGGIRIPDIGAPDELEHVGYIQFMVDGRGFPVLDPQNPNAGAGYQSHQPPLFYLLETGVAKLTGQTDLKQKSAGLILRSFNVLIGCADVLGVFFLGFWGFARKDLGLAGAAFFALLPMNLALSGAISNDPLLYALCTWTLAATALACRQGWTLKRGIVIGILLGLAFLTKTTAVALVPAVLVGAFLSKTRPSVKVVAAAACVALVLALPWWIRNQSLYGDPFAMKAFNEAFVNSPTRASLHADWGRYLSVEFLLTWNSFVGDFGYMDIPLPSYIAGSAAFVLAIMALGGLLALRKPEWEGGKAISYMNITFILLVVLSYIAFNIRYFQAQARYLFPAIAPISLGFGLGLIYYAGPRWKMSFNAWVVALTLMNLYIVTVYLPGEFAARLI
jgi:4-amino-4-deoxy-L-arabinose transferase-like glycosyltransferase